MEKWVPEKCACCGEKFEKRSKGYDRTEIRSRCRGNAASVVDALYSLYDVTLTPNKNTFACNRCSCLISTLAAKRAQLEETETRLQNVKLAGGYISCNIPATTLLKTPQQTKSERGGKSTDNEDDISSLKQQCEENSNLLKNLSRDVKQILKAVNNWSKTQTHSEENVNVSSGSQEEQGEQRELLISENPAQEINIEGKAKKKALMCTPVKINAFQAFSSENLKKLQLCMTGKEAFRRNAIDWKHLDEQERLKYRFKADLLNQQTALKYDKYLKSLSREERDNLQMNLQLAREEKEAARKKSRHNASVIEEQDIRDDLNTSKTSTSSPKKKKHAEIYTDPGEDIPSDGDMSEKNDFVDTTELSGFITPKTICNLQNDSKITTSTNTKVKRPAVDNGENEEPERKKKNLQSSDSTKSPKKTTQKDHPWILEDSDSGSESEREQTPQESTVKPVHMVTSIQKPPVLKVVSIRHLPHKTIVQVHPVTDL